MNQVGSRFSFYGLVSLVIGICYSFCLYKNPGGLAFPVFIMIFYGAAFLVLKKMEMEVKKGSYALIGISILIGCATCRTTSEFFWIINKAALFLLGIVFWLHQCYQDRYWNIGKYLESMIIFCVSVISTIAYPLHHGLDFVKAMKDKKYRTMVLAFLGMILSVPFVAVLAIILSHADMVFRNLLIQVLDSFLNPVTVISVVGKALFGFLVMYCLICGIVKKGINEEQKDYRTKEPVIAITVMSMIGILYLMFCVIQIVYLFFGKGKLPGTMTYSEYARQGFFQLVFVAALNLVMVLACLKYFKESRWLNGVLTVISICTYVMIASAGYRMMLYVQEYHLTLLRILVLWFLLVLSFLMAGVLVMIYRNQFPLFQYCLMIVSVGYLVLVWMKPDFVIADYNVNHMEQIMEPELYYLSRLSADAAPVLWEVYQRDEMKDQENMNRLLNRYFADIQQNMTWRTYNFSYAKAQVFYDAAVCDTMDGR